jgi:hypothetical protein
MPFDPTTTNALSPLVPYTKMPGAYVERNNERKIIYHVSMDATRQFVVLGFPPAPLLYTNAYKSDVTLINKDDTNANRVVGVTYTARTPMDVLDVGTTIPFAHDITGTYVREQGIVSFQDVFDKVDATGVPLYVQVAFEHFDNEDNDGYGLCFIVAPPPRDPVMRPIPLRDTSSPSRRSRLYTEEVVVPTVPPRKRRLNRIKSE